MIEVPLVEQDGNAEVREFLARELIQILLFQLYLVELSTLLLELLVLVSDDLALFLELVPQQILEILPEINHLSRSELLIFFLIDFLFLREQFLIIGCIDIATVS